VLSAGEKQERPLLGAEAAELGGEGAEEEWQHAPETPQVRVLFGISVMYM
jgi:hypothetical protein